MQKTLRLLLTFYRSYFFVTFLITCCCLYIFSMYGIEIFVALFWSKISTLGLIYYFIKTNKSKEFYYYQNLGISKLLLWSTTLIFDFIIFISLLILVHKLR